MSFQAMAWAIDEELPTKEKFVLLMLANYASNDNWDCYPSIAVLSKDTGMSKATVMRALKSLEELGYLSIIRRMVDGINLPNIYRLIKNSKVYGGSITQTPPLSHSNQGSITQTPGVVSHSNTNLSYKPINEPIKKIYKKNTTGSRLPDDFVIPDEWILVAKKLRPELTDHEIRFSSDKFIDYWHSATGAKANKRDWLATWRNWIRDHRQRMDNIRKFPVKKQELDFSNTDWIDGVADLL